MAQQKLYTEEQVKDMLNGVMHEHQIDDFLKAYYTPIELPSDEEIEEAAPYVPQDASMDFWANQEGFIDGAKWMRDKIQNK